MCLEIVSSFVFFDCVLSNLWIPIKPLVKLYTPYLLPINMAEFSNKPNRFQMSFKKKERKFFKDAENELMDELHIATKSDLYKYSLKFLKASRTKSDLAMV